MDSSQSPSYNKLQESQTQYAPDAQAYYHPQGVALPPLGELVKLEKGLYHFYKIWMIVYIGFMVLALLGLFAGPIKQIGTPQLIGGIVACLFPIPFNVLEYQAINHKDIKKAKIAVGGFTAHMIINFILTFCLAFQSHTAEEFLAPIGFAVFGALLSYILLLFGATRVHNLLKNNMDSADPKAIAYP